MLLAHIKKEKQIDYKYLYVSNVKCTINGVSVIESLVEGHILKLYVAVIAWVACGAQALALATLNMRCLAIRINLYLFIFEIEYTNSFEKLF